MTVQCKKAAGFSSPTLPALKVQTEYPHNTMQENQGRIKGTTMHYDTYQSENYEAVIFEEILWRIGKLNVFMNRNISHWQMKFIL